MEHANDTHEIDQRRDYAHREQAPLTPARFPVFADEFLIAPLRASDRSTVVVSMKMLDPLTLARMTDAACVEAPLPVVLT
ncbi:hypothetical protein [Streptomyces sp. NPDC002132]|uniref:hypothetical protein n=1 Tax=unclassified Streptomyces TaxID=2593676 RepID=UPI00331C8C97